jgi:hypothetical protein
MNCLQATQAGRMEPSFACSRYPWTRLLRRTCACAANVLRHAASVQADTTMAWDATVALSVHTLRFPLATSHRITVFSMDAETSPEPSGAHATSTTSSACPLHVWRQLD